MLKNCIIWPSMLRIIIITTKVMLLSYFKSDPMILQNHTFLKRYVEVLLLLVSNILLPFNARETQKNVQTKLCLAQSENKRNRVGQLV